MKKVFLLLFTGICLLACEKTIDLNIPMEGSKMVLHSYLNPDSTLKVQLSKSAFVLDHIQNRQNISAARVRVLEDDKELGTMQHLANGWYEMVGTYPKEGKTYRIEAEMDGMEKLVASELVLQPVEMFEVSIDTLGTDEMGFVEVELSFFIKDPVGENFYMSQGFYNATIKAVNPDDGSVQTHIFRQSFTREVDDPSLESFCYYTCVSLLRDQFFEGRQYNFRLRGKLPKFEGELIIEDESFSIQLYNVSRTYYLYHATLQKNMESRNDPFAEPTLIFTNVEGGYGILGAMTGSSQEIDLK